MLNHEQVDAETVDRLRKDPKNRDFAALHVCPPETSDVVDESRARIVLLHPESTRRRMRGESRAVSEAHRFLERRSSAQRLYKNMLVFVATDEQDTEAL
jgi:hypothetical protein